MDKSRDDRREDEEKADGVGEERGPQHAPGEAASFDGIIEHGGGERRNDAEHIGHRQQNELMEIDVRWLAQRDIQQAEQAPE